jgi:alpha-1,2-mannosyltransferase
VRPTTRLALLTAGCCFAIIVAWSLLPSYRSLGLGGDFTAYYSAALALRSGLSLYDPMLAYHLATTHGCVAITPYAYPPLFAILMVPFSYLPCGTSLILWDALAAACLGGSLWLLQELWPRSLRTFAFFCAGALCLFPLWSGFWWGQIHTLLLFAFLWVLWRVEQHDHWGAGIMLGFISWIQVIPGLFVIYLALRREWKAVATTLLTGLALLGVMLVIPGPATLLRWFSGLVGVYHFFNGQTINFSPLHLFGPWTALPVLALYLFALVSVPRTTFRTGYLWTITTMFMLSPVTWDFYFLWLLPAAWEQWERRRTVLIALLILVNIAVYSSRSLLAALLVAIWCLQWQQVERSRTSVSLAYASGSGVESAPSSSR